jgi:DNA-binding SARP family transcriptional activator/transcriptional regulator with XRE-family HTH domain
MLRRRRRLAGLSQEELAERAVVSVRTVRNIEGGRITTPRPSSVRALADALDLDDPERREMFALATPASGEYPAAAPAGPAATAGADPTQPPVVNREMLVRERLLDRMSARWLVPVTVVSAPAGYGKTTLLDQAVMANAESPVGIDCWLTCGPDMAAASSFGAALCRAVEAPPVPGGPDGVANVADLANAVVAAIWRRSPQPVALVLDDVHEIPPDSETARLLDAVVCSLPANGHVVLAGRETPPVRLARLEVEGRVVRLDEVDLAFTDEEVVGLAALRGAPAPRVATSGGWPALAELFASVRPSATEDPAGDYVAQEVLSGLPPAKRRDLGLLAEIGPFDEDLARAVLGPDVDVADLLHGLPLVTLVAGGEWCLHALWQSLVARDVTPAEVADVRRRAGMAWLRRGWVGTAVRLLIDAEAWDEFSWAIAEALGVAHPPVARDVLAEWFERLPPKVRAGPGGRLLAAVQAVDGDPDGARRLLEECAADFRAAGHAAGEIACLVQLGQMAWWSEDPDALAAAAAQAFELEAAGCEEVEPLACLARALLFDIDNDSRRMLAELDRIRPGSLNEAWWGIVSWARAIGLLELGHTPEALEAADDALAHAGFLHAPLAQSTRLQTLWFQGKTGEVLDALPGLLVQVKRSGYRNHTSLVASQCAVTHALMGRGNLAAGYLAQAQVEATVAAEAPLVDANLSIAAAALAVAEGDEAGAAEVLAAHAARRPVRKGLAAAPHQRHLALFYVLVPATRPVWDHADLGPVWAHARHLARAVVAVREGRELPRATPALDDAGVVQAHLPPPWLAELALAAIACGREDGWQLLDATWPVTRPTVSGLAELPDGPVTRAAREALGRLAAPPTSRLDLRLLGPVELCEDDAPVQAAAWTRQHVRSLLAYLALNRTVGRKQLADDLWPGLEPDAQSRNIRAALADLLGVLEPDRGRRDASFFVRQHGDSVWLHPGDWLTVDLWEFDAECDRAAEADRRGAPAAALDHAQRAVELWRGEPTELASEPWAVVAVGQRRIRFAATATRAGELLLAQGNAECAQALAREALAAHPGLEAARRLQAASKPEPRVAPADPGPSNRIGVATAVRLSRLG